MVTASHHQEPQTLPSPDPRAGRRVGPRAAMIFGFCALLVLMGFLAFDSVHALNKLEMSNSAVRQDYLNRERTLRDIRFSLYESGNLLREYFLARPDASARDSYLNQFHDLRDHANAALDSCLRALPRDHNAAFQKLSNELASYWLLADRIFIVDPTEKNTLSLRNLALTQRASLLTLTGEVSDISELDFRQAEAQISLVFAQTRHRILVVAVFALSLGLLLAASSILYLSRLERHAREKYEETLHSQRELKELSKRLVDAQEQERRAIARELHDQIGQSLTALLIDLQNLSDTPQPTSAISSALQRVKLLAEECVNEVRNMALLLRPSMLDDLGQLPLSSGRAAKSPNALASLSTSSTANLPMTSPKITAPASIAWSRKISTIASSTLTPPASASSLRNRITACSSPLKMTASALIPAATAAWVFLACKSASRVSAAISSSIRSLVAALASA